MKQFTLTLGRSIVIVALAVMALIIPNGLRADDGVWRRTLIVTTLDNVTMEYLIDKDTKVKIEKPNLVIETEGIVLSYELDNMSQMRYGKKFVPNGVERLKADQTTPFRMGKGVLHFSNLKADTQIRLYTTDGKVVMQRQCSGNAQVPLSELAAGVYFVGVNNDTYKIVKK